MNAELIFWKCMQKQDCGLFLGNTHTNTNGIDMQLSYSNKSILCGKKPSYGEWVLVLALALALALTMALDSTWNLYTHTHTVVAKWWLIECFSWQFISVYMFSEKSKA